MRSAGRVGRAGILCVVGAVVIASCADADLRGSGIAAGDDWPPLPPEALDYVREGLEPDMLASLTAGDERDMGFTSPVTDLELGEPAPTYLLTRELRRGEAPADRASAFRFTGEWAIPVSQHGSVRTAVTIGKLGRGPWERITLGYGLDLAEALLTVRRGDLLVFDGPLDAWFWVRGDTVTELSQGRPLLHGSVSLARFRQLVVADHRSRIPVGPDEAG